MRNSGLKHFGQTTTVAGLFALHRLQVLSLNLPLTIYAPPHRKHSAIFWKPHALSVMCVVLQDNALVLMRISDPFVALVVSPIALKHQAHAAYASWLRLKNLITGFFSATLLPHATTS